MTCRDHAERAVQVVDPAGADALLSEWVACSPDDLPAPTVAWLEQELSDAAATAEAHVDGGPDAGAALDCAYAVAVHLAAHPDQAGLPADQLIARATAESA